MFHRLFLLIAALWLPLSAQAHEVQPAIADFQVENGFLTLDMTIALEPVIAGVNLDGLADTNESGKAEDVDALRALPPDALKARFDTIRSDFLSAIAITTDGWLNSPVTLTVDVPEVGEVDLPRESTLRILAPLPANPQVLNIKWPAEYGTLVLRQQGVENPYTGYLTSGEGSGDIALGGGDQMTALEAFTGYIPVGFDHILPKGLDHILFVLGLFFLSSRLNTLLWQVSAFTLAHTVTLALGALGYVNIPGSIVEPLIAASIVYVAVENILSDKLNKWRPMVIFGFGLLHGLGFASVLGDFGLPAAQFIPALIGFNIGVEIGQLTVIAMAFLLVFVALRVDNGDSDEKFGMVFYAILAVIFAALGVILDGDGFRDVTGASAHIFLWPVAMLCVLCALSAYELDKLNAYRRFVAVPASAAIALVGAYWFVERVFL
ncbi:HupE/UreJ family protein [Pseudoprimorskyibacter insulae]|uniref:HupE / UreJ protein n=1 Tax=Pseudoprimorskyibacter insulae TaxID=1695997 RepID=A0A2R8AYZ9_9RHOB|nr:HupE/UreJ family protein [Pseudoprimorskyibacter insulae]SPF81265.1 hypothetical protein PRI8871_03087 [Pseudoprimorskyibacter insulae]